MDLRTGTTLWRAISPAAPVFDHLRGDHACEVAVLGGGITGALLGHILTQAGVGVVMVDKRTPGEGSTAASTGLLQYEVDVPLTELIAKRGREAAVHAYRRGLAAIDEIEELTAALGDDCGFSRRSSLYLASKCLHVRHLKREFACRRDHGFEVEWLARGDLARISSLVAPAAIRSTGDAQIDPYRFTQRLLQHAVQGGMRVFAQSEVTAVTEDSQGVSLTTAEGRLTAQAVVYATGYEADEQLKVPADLQTTYVVTSKPHGEFPGWPAGCLLWESARPYFYARQTSDGRAIIGGGDTAFAEDHQRPGWLEAKAAKLQQRFKTLFPAAEFTPEFAWAGTFAETRDGLALIGLVPRRARTYAALGYGGNGITFSVIASRLIADLFLRRSNPDQAVFSFQR